jgi:hypothetical protein
MSGQSDTSWRAVLPPRPSVRRGGAGGIIARRATQHLQELMENTKLHNSAMSDKELMSALEEANGNWSTGKLQEMYQGAIENAEMTADRTGKEGNVYRTAAERLLKNKQTRRWIPKDHVEQLENIVKGSATPNTLRWISNFFGGDESLLKGIGTAILTGEPMHGAAMVGGSKALGALGERMTKSQWGKLRDETSRSSPAAKKDTSLKVPSKFGAGDKAMNLASTMAGRRIRNEGE